MTAPPKAPTPTGGKLKAKQAAAEATTIGIRAATHDYSGVRALQDVDFELRSRSIHGLVGENGSGKSTLIKILTGAVRPTAGTIYVNGSEVSFSSPVDAQRYGIGVVHQDYHLFPDLSVAANVYGVSKTPPRRRWSRTVDKREVERRVEQLFGELGIKVAPQAMVRELGAAERKFVEIARAMLLRPRFLILDEPTASLEPKAAHSVLALLERLREQGVGLAFVSHRLDEVLRISNQITVLRDGRQVASPRNERIGEERLAELIVGSKPIVSGDGARSVGEEIAVRVRGIRLSPGVRPVEFEVRRGEIFGFTGLVGSGAAEVVRMLGGAIPLLGEVEIEGATATIRSPRDASRAGIGFIPEDRKGVGLVADQSVAINISLPSLRRVANLIGWMNRRLLLARANEYRERLAIRASSVQAPVNTLSGGNQQKVMLAKWLASGVRILAVEEPTHGIDIGGKAQVHELLRELTSGGGTVIVGTTDVHEALTLCDRIAVMRHGMLLEVLDTEELTHADLTAMGTRDSDELLSQLIESGEGGGGGARVAEG